jgi:hypothetical protein
MLPTVELSVALQHQVAMDTSMGRAQIKLCTVIVEENYNPENIQSCMQLILLPCNFIQNVPRIETILVQVCSKLKTKIKL